MHRKIKAQISKYARTFTRRGSEVYLKRTSETHIFDSYDDFANFMEKCKVENKNDKEYCRMCDWWWYVV